MKKIAIFASGSGTNAENISNYFSTNQNIEIQLILTNKKSAYVVERAKKLNIKTVVFNRDDLYKNNFVINILQKNNIDLIVLAGFLWLIPNNLINAYSNKIINIHPALLPKYGGKGMYGDKVHKAVIENNEQESGITIHLVNEKYDEGKIIEQVKCKVEIIDTADTLAQKIHKLEYKYFPKVIEDFLIFKKKIIIN